VIERLGVDGEPLRIEARNGALARGEAHRAARCGLARDAVEHGRQRVRLLVDQPARLAVDDDLGSYSRRFLRARGGLLAAYDVFRRYSQHFEVEDLAALMRAGLLDSEASAAGTAQRWPRLDAATLGSKLMGLARAPAQAPRLAKVSARMSAAAGLYSLYPSDEGWPLHAWSRAIARVVGDPEPDLPMRARA